MSARVASTRPSTARAARRGVVAAVTSLAFVLTGLVAAAPASAADPDLARFGTITASASQNDQDGSFPASNAIDGDATTRWASGNGPDSATEPFAATLTSDLGSIATVTGVTIAWESAYASGYEVQTAATEPDADSSWTTVEATTTGAGGTEVIAFDEAVQARYVRLVMTQRVAFTWDPAGPHYYGYSVFSFEVNGTLALPVAAFGSAGITANAGDTVTVPIALSNPAASDQAVRVTTGGGSAGAGTDYTAVDQVVTFAAGSTTAEVQVETASQGALVPVRTFDLTLAEPTDGIALGSRSTVTVTLRPTGDLPNVGSVRVLHDFEDGVPAGLFNWGINDAVKPVLATAGDDGIPGADASNQVLTATVGGDPAEGDWFGFSNDTATSDWSDGDGFSFWFRGTGGGKTLSFEVKNGNQLFDRNVVDDTEGWRQVSVLFTDLRLKGNAADPARFDPSASTGFAVTLTGLGAGTWAFDDFAVFERAIRLEDFQGDVRVNTPSTGFFTWGSSENLVTLGVTDQERGDVPDNRVLSGTYLIPSGGYGGFSDNLAVSQDWSSFRGIRFWWYASQASNPASPTAGDDIKVEIKDGGPDGEHSELWSTTFKDNWGSSTSRWKLVELPFSSFSLGAYQPGSAATQNGTLDLTTAWGFAPTFTPGKPTTTGWAIDDVELYGTPAQAVTASVSTSQDVYLVDAGEAAEVAVAVTTTSGEPLESPVTVAYSDGDGTAEAGTDYTGFGGELTFPAGTESGATQTVTVQTTESDAAAEAKTISMVLDSTTAALPDNPPRIVINAQGLPYLDASLPTSERVDDLMGRMSLAEKVGQMAQAERLGLQSPQQIADLGLGSVLSGGGSVPTDNSPTGWADMVDGFQRQALSTPLQIPLLYGIDSVHGHSNLEGATIFPHNSGLGATRDPDLVQRISELTAEETKATGPNWAFAPCLCVTRDERWGRSYESFGEDPALVRSFAEATTVGLQGEDPAAITDADEVLATAKHWAGDGGTAYDASKAGSGYPIDQGLTTSPSLEAFEQLYVTPYLPSIAAGVGTIMPSYSGVDLNDGRGDVRMHENTLLNTDVLKGELGFDGFLISDWEGIDKLPGGTYPQKVVRSVNSGLDMAMAPYNFGAFITSVEDAVAAGDIDQSRVDDAVRRILTQKMALGVFENPLTDRANQDAIGSAEHRAVARQAVAESQVLLKNDGVLPLAAGSSVYVAGSNADDLGRQMGGWSISWQGGSGDTTTGTTIFDGIRAVSPDATFSQDASADMAGHDVGVVVVGEAPYAEGQGDVGNNGKSLSLSAADQTTIDRVCGAMPCVVLIVAGRTQLVTDQLAEIDGLVASALPGTEGDGVADVLFGAKPFTGRLPVSWPRTADQVPINVGDASYDPLYAYGWGLRTDAPRDRIAALAASLPAGDAQVAIQRLVDADVWDATGQASDAATVVRLASAAAAALTGTDRETLAAADILVSVVRDLAQTAVVAGTAPSDSSTLTADAEHALLSGDPVTAITLLAQVAGVSAERAVLDDFDRANGAVGSDWAVSTSTRLYRIAGEALDVQLGGPLVWRESFGVDQEASVLLTRIDKKHTQGLVLKAQATSVRDASGITVLYDARAKAVKITASRGLFSGTSTYRSLPVDLADGDILGARVSASGTVEVMRNDEVIGSVQLYRADAGYFATRGGHIGVWSVAATSAVLDDFAGGTVTP